MQYKEELDSLQVEGKKKPEKTDEGSSGKQKIVQSNNDDFQKELKEKNNQIETLQENISRLTKQLESQPVKENTKDFIAMDKQQKENTDAIKKN